MKKNGLKLYTYFLFAIIFMAVALTSSIIIFNKNFTSKSLIKKINNVTSVNSKIADMILEKQSAVLLSSMKDMEFSFASASDAYLKGNIQKFEELMLSLYEQAFAQTVDVFIFVSADKQYIFDSSSPFFNTKGIRNSILRESNIEDERTRFYQAVTEDGTMLALTTSTSAVSKTTGEIAGKVYAGIILNNNARLINEIMQSVGLSEAAIIYGDQIIAGITKGLEDNIINACYNEKVRLANGNVSYCSPLHADGVNLPVTFYQSFPDEIIKQISDQNKKITYTSIAITLAIIILSGFLMNKLIVRSLYKLVNFTERTLRGQEEPQLSTHIKEFNQLSTQIAEVNNELSETQAFLQNLIKRADAPIAVWDKEGNITVFNYSMEKLSGIRHDNVIGKHISHIYSIFPEATVDTSGRDDKDISAARFESIVRNKQNGKIYFVFWSITDVYSSDEYFGTILQGMDITDRKSSEEKLLLASKVFENTSEAIFITDESGIISSVNKAFTEITGYTEDEALGKTNSIINSNLHDEEFFKQLWKSLRESGKWKGEIWNKRKTGESYPAIQTISSIRNKKGEVTHYISVIHDITERKHYEEEIKYQATHDRLTGLVNKEMFETKLSDAIDQRESEEDIFAVTFLDLDRFKNLNDSLGHHIGDKILQIIARRITESVKQVDTVSRFGGDEYALIIESCKEKKDAIRLSTDILRKIQEPISIQGYELFIQTSTGIAFYPDDGKSSEELIKNADTTLFKAKSMGRNNLQQYTSELNMQVKKKLMIESKLNRAIENNEFSVHYQPKIDLISMKIMGMEALIRWNNDELGNLSPETFIPIAEETGLILPIGEWVMRKAAEDTVELHKMGFNNLKIAVNLSLRQFLRKDLVRTVDKTLAATGLDRFHFEFEITENVFSEDLKTISRIMNELNDMEIKFAIDDFGTGYSSIGYLKKLPIHTLKIDRSYTNMIDTDRESETIVSSVILMAKSLGLSIVAEGAETENQVKLLKSMGCDIVQGYFYSRPLPLERLIDFIKEWNESPRKI
jgi:diguanylate cyclase (GGDEF)-like protein/PAS domain S-box-containing protein